MYVNKKHDEEGQKKTIKIQKQSNEDNYEKIHLWKNGQRVRKS